MPRKQKHAAPKWFLFSFVTAIGITLVMYATFSPMPAPKERVVLRVEPGMGAKRVSHELKQLGLIRSEYIFRMIIKVRGSANRIQPGIYPFDKGLTPLAVLFRLEKPGGEGGEVRFLEGWTIARYAQELKEVGVDSAEFIAACHDIKLLQQFHIDANSAEGYLFPDTYQMLPGVMPREAVKRMLTRFREIVPDSLDSLGEEFGLSLHEMITLASIIESEVQQKPEAPMVSAVYHNRLRRNMLLQADPTIQYILPGPPRRLFLRDLEMESPYNTYKYAGLPPGPICNPGKNAIYAAYHPADVDYIYFVSQADGSHAFNTTLQGHLKSKVVLDSARHVLSMRRIAERDSIKRARTAAVPPKVPKSAH